MYTCSSCSNPTDLSCLECCNNCLINKPYVNCIMPRKQEATTSNRQNLPSPPSSRLICHRINTNDDTGWQRSRWYHLSSGTAKGAAACDMWRPTLVVSVCSLCRVQLTGGRTGRETSEGFLVRCESAVSSTLSLRCEGLSETVLRLEKSPKRYRLTEERLWTTGEEAATESKFIQLILFLTKYLLTWMCFNLFCCPLRAMASGLCFC